MKTVLNKNKQFAWRHIYFIAILYLACYCTFGQTDPVVSPLLTGHYIPGLINIRDYANPSPASGLMVVDYNAFLSGDKYYDKDGNQVKQINGPLGAPIDLNLDIGGYANSLNLLWVSKSKIFGANYLGGISATYTTVNLNLAYSRIGFIEGSKQSGEISGQVSGLSDLGFIPLLLSWAKEKFDITAGYIFYAPTGKYKTGGNDNLGLGFWSHILQFNGYYYPLEIDGERSKAMAIMFSGNYELTSKIKDADVTPGNRFSIDYGISQYLSDKLEVGIFGGNNWQVSKDKGGQVYWDASIKDKLGIAGIQLGYWLLPGRLQTTGKYGFNYGAVQQFKMNTFQINLLFIVNPPKN